MSSHPFFDFVLFLVYNLLSQYNIFIDPLPFKECSLIGWDDFPKQLFQLVCFQFCYELIASIGQANRSKITELVCIINIRN